MNPNALIEFATIALVVAEGVILSSSLQRLYEMRYRGWHWGGNAMTQLLGVINEMKRQSLNPITAIIWEGLWVRMDMLVAIPVE